MREGRQEGGGQMPGGWSRAGAREFDRRLKDEVGIPGVVLMENAGRGAAEWILANAERLGLGGGGRVGVLCGKGNNGGDGYVVARHLVLGGVDVVIGGTSEAGDLSRDAQVFRGVCEWMGMELVDLVGGDGWVSPALDSVMGRVELWVDGLLGTGFRPPLGDLAVLLLGMVEKARASTGASVVALDCPSGMDVDTGALSDGGLRADVTLTFAATKAGFLVPGAPEVLGEVAVIGIGVPVAGG